MNGLSVGARRLLLLLGLALAVGLLRLLVDRDLDGRLSLLWPRDAILGFRCTALTNGALAGAALGVSGALLQALLRNPLASPYILGVSSGAGVGVMFASYLAYLGGTVLPQFLGTLLPAALGALLTLGLVYLLGQRRGWIDPVSMLLVGVVVGTLCSALIMFLQHLVPTGLRGEFTTWLMGHVPEVTATVALMVAATVVGAGVVVALAMADAMDVAMFSEDEARSIGLHLGRLRLGLFLLSGLLAATAVALVGPIGFVGLVAPHATRLLLGPRHRLLIAGSAVCGMIFLVGADLLRQALDFGAGRMPPGIFTALVGGPVFLYLLRRGRGGRWP